METCSGTEKLTSEKLNNRLSHLREVKLVMGDGVGGISWRSVDGNARFQKLMEDPSERPGLIARAWERTVW